MSQIVDQRLFELVQVVNISSPIEHGPRKRVSLRSLAKQVPASNRSRQLVSFAASPCGRLVLFVAAAPQEVSDTPCEVDNRPFIGAVQLSKGGSIPPDLSCGNFIESESIEADIQWLPWFLDTAFRPTCLTVSPETDFCLVGCENGSLFVLATKVICPALDLKEKEANWSHKKTHKVFPLDSSLETKAALTRTEHPTSITWWAPQDHHSYVIVGTRSGWIVLIDLVSGVELGYTHLTNYSITHLEQLTDAPLDCTYLFITNEKGKQWRILLERRATGFTWCGRKNIVTSASTSDVANAKTLHANGAADIAKKQKSPADEDVSTRSRLAGLKQMSVASLASLRQRLSESKRILDIRGKGGGGIWSSSQSSDSLATGDGSTSPNATSPEPLACKVGDTLLSVQSSRDAPVLAGLFPDTSILTLHNSDLEVLPQVAFRLPRNTDKVLILDKVMIVANKIDERSPGLNQMTLQVVSSHHAEIHLDSRSKEDPVLQNFALSEHEKVLGFHRLSAIHARVPASSNSSTSHEDEQEVEDPSPSGQQIENQDQTGAVQDPKERFVTQVQFKVASAKSRGLLMFEPCLVVTSCGVFIIKLARDPVTTFLECSMQGDIKTAEHTATTFELDGRSLLELAADIRLSKRDFPGAIALYRLSGCKHLKAVLKFASSGHVQELLSYLTILFKTSSADLTFTDRIHLSNLMLMAYFQQALTKNSSVDGKAEFVSRVCAFMDENHFFDSGLAVRLSAETREWGLLHHFCHTQGLYREMMATICSTFSEILQGKPAIGNSFMDLTGRVLMEFTQSERKNLWSCLSNGNNLTSCMAIPNLGIETLRILVGVLPALDVDDLERQVFMCDPNRPDFRPLLRNLLDQTHPQDAETSLDDFVLKLLNYYVTVELLLLKKLVSSAAADSNGDTSSCNISTYDSNLVKIVSGSTGSKSVEEKQLSIYDRLTCKLIDAGSSHVLIVRPRSGTLFSFGSTHFGILGHSGPLLTSSVVVSSQQHSVPKPVEFFSQINRSSEPVQDAEDLFNGLKAASEDQTKPKSSISVLSVACGKTHSLALTDCGLYAWGSSKYGQLGLGRETVMSRQPCLINELSDNVLVSISAGSYHSVAVDVNGKLWTWGWGVHGQLGLDSIEDEFLPKRVLHREMHAEKVVQVEAGYAHTLVLTAVGHVWVFGCGLFGQLGIGDNKKRTNPVRVDFKETIRFEGIDDTIGTIAAGYFHNMAVSSDGLRLYTWGCNPQVLRLEAQQKRKDRLQNNLRNEAKSDASPPESSEDQTDESKAKENGDLTEKKIDDQHHNDEMLHLLPSRVNISAVHSPIKSVACGNQHSMILLDNGSVFTFGRNIDGQLGIGSRKESKLPTLVWPLEEEKICQISAGGDYSLALSESGSLFAWGSNTGGQLGKPPLDGSGKDTDKVVVMKGTKRIIRLPHSLQNSCDIPKPVIGINSGVYSDEVHETEKIRKRFSDGCRKMANTVKLFSRLKMSSASKAADVGAKIQRHRLNLHLCLELFYAHLEGKKLVKKSLISDNPQAAAKICLLKERNVLQAFEMTLQSCIKQRPQVTLQVLSQSIFEAFDYYIHYKVDGDDETSDDEGGNGEVPKASQVKKHLLERLIACWQDQKFSFVHLERLLLERSTPILLQTLVLTLFCPSEDRDDEGEDGPMTSSCGEMGAGPKLVDLFTPEFCLKIGDTFVKSFRSEPPGINIDKWIQNRLEENPTTKLPSSDQNEFLPTLPVDVIESNETILES